MRCSLLRSLHSSVWSEPLKYVRTGVIHRSVSSKWVPTTLTQPKRGKKDEANSAGGSSLSSTTTTLSHLFIPVPIKPNPSTANNVGAELTGKLNKQEVLKILNKFFRRSEIKLVSIEQGLDSTTTPYYDNIHHYFSICNYDLHNISKYSSLLLVNLNPYTVDRIHCIFNLYFPLPHNPHLVYITSPFNFPQRL